jgi:hypothetical protein
MSSTETLVISIVAAVTGGLIVLGIQILREKIKEKKDRLGRKLVGKTELKIIDKDFLYNYEPEKVSIEKIIADFGAPIKKSKGKADSGKKLAFYKYVFQNAKVEFCTYKNDSDILSTTVYSEEDINHPVICRRSFDEDEEFFGKAKITDIIIEASTSFENFSSPRDANAIIIAKYYGYPTIKHLYFCYQIDGNYENLSDTKDQVIKQVCITQLSSICPTFSVWDTFYS